MARKMSPNQPPIGEVLRVRRVTALKKGLREMARPLDIAPAHLTDIEKGRRSPSDGLLKRISLLYGIAEPELRAGWSKADGVVEEVATQNTMTAKKVLEFLRTPRKLSSEQWDRLIGQARRMASGKGGKLEK